MGVADAVKSQDGSPYAMADATKSVLNSQDAALANSPTKATITVGTPAANVCQVTVQLKNSKNANIAAIAGVRAFVSNASPPTSFNAVGSTGIAAGTGGLGAVQTIVSKALFQLISNNTGEIDLQFTDTGSNNAFLNVILPNGTIVTSANMKTN